MARRLTALAGIGVLSFACVWTGAGCEEGDPGGAGSGGGAAADAGETPGTGGDGAGGNAGLARPVRQFVARSLIAPASPDEVAALALDIDGDPRAGGDNAFGQFLAEVAGPPGALPQTTLDRGLADGVLVQLFDLERLEAGQSSRLSLFVGDDRDGDPSDNFSGREMFAIATGSPVDSALRGRLTRDRELVAGPGLAPVRLPLAFPSTSPILLHLVGARVRARVTDDTMEDGVLGGAFTAEEIDRAYLPALAERIAAAVAADCPTGPASCEVASPGSAYLALFDAGGDGSIDESELRASELVQTTLAPDVDLFDADGAFAPRSDGVVDSVSFGMGFTAVGATFELP